MKKDKNKKKKLITSIGGKIRANNKVMIKTMLTIVIFSGIIFILTGSCASYIKKLADNSLEIEEARKYLSEWTIDAVIALTEGEEIQNEPDSGKCGTAQWLEKFSGMKITDAEVQDAYSNMLLLHEEMHQMYNENVGISFQNDPVKATEIITQLEEKQRAYSEEIDHIIEYYSSRQEMNFTGIEILVIVAMIVNTLFAITTPRYIRRASNKLSSEIADPVNAVADWATELSLGSDQLEFNSMSTDINEINKMITAFQVMAKGIEENVHVVQRVAEGDMTAFVNIRSSKDSLSKSLYKMVQTNDLMFNEITEIANAVAGGADDIANASGTLANSCTEQIHSIADFKEAVSETVDLINENVDRISKSRELSGAIKDEVAVSNEKMEELLKAMEAISESSNKIFAVIKTIEDLADQTNLLALNASIEAARAGEAGKGFAVVASEVGSLASQSANAVVESRLLIEDTIQKAEIGNRITNETSETFGKIVERVDAIYEFNDAMTEAGAQQKVKMQEIESDIQGIADAVDTSAAISEETAASCDLLNANADRLRQSMSKFNLRKREPGKAYIPPEKQGDEEFKRLAQQNYEEAVKDGKAK